jgi:hypothetical protein
MRVEGARCKKKVCKHGLGKSQYCLETPLENPSASAAIVFGQMGKRREENLRRVHDNKNREMNPLISTNWPELKIQYPR